MIITFVTGNLTKIPIARQHLAPYGVTVDHVRLELEEIQSTSVETVACHKARQAFDLIRRPLIVEDSGMYIDEFGGWPGPMVKQLVTAIGARGIAHLADLTTGRSCSFVTTLAYVGAEGDLTTFTEHGEAGRIATTPAVDGAFGTASPLWDLFIPPGHDAPLSVLPEPDRRAIQDAWSTVSVFAQFGRWLANGTEPTVPGRQHRA